MELTEEEKRTQEEACTYIEENKDRLIKEFILDKRPLRLNAITLFMAGSPGAGKTEFSQRYMPGHIGMLEERVQKRLKEKGYDLSRVDTLFVRIDVDEIRSFLPQYTRTDPKLGTKANAHVVQAAANKGLDILRNYCLDNEVSFLHDGTFGNYGTMKQIVKKSLRDGRSVHIYYLYLDPLTAWNFTKAREYVEGRNILKEKFIEQFYNSMQNVNRIKEEFPEVKVHVVVKNEKNEVETVEFNAPSLDQFLKTQYNKGTIRKYEESDLSQLIS